MKNHLFFTITNCQIVRPCSLPHRINYKFMCCPGNERARICAVSFWGRLRKKLFLTHPHSLKGGDPGNEFDSYWRYVLTHVHSKRIYPNRHVKEVTYPTFGLQNSSLEWFFNHLSVVKPKLKFTL